MHTPRQRLRLAVRVFPFLAVAAATQAAGLELRKGDHVCIIGNTLAERFQYDGWLETYLQSRFPEHELVVRNLGFSGDELTLRLRSEAFGSPDDHLAFSKASVVFAFFGFNESFAGEAGLAKFKEDLDGFLKGTLEKKYDGESPPRLALFSPIAHEDLKSPNLPDGHDNNRRIALYTEAMAAVAKARGVVFVDLFKATQDLYRSATRPLTFNGIHLTEDGNRLLAEAIDRALFEGPPAGSRDAAALEKLRGAVKDKDFHWFHRYRTVDGYSVFGGRSWLRFVDNQTNREVMQREMEVLDVLTANRDRRIWAVAQGGDLRVDDSNTPEFIPVKTNKPGKGPDGEHLFLSGEEAIGQMRTAPGMKVSLFASEKEFPDLAKPVQMAFDPKGRLFVAVMPSYPHWKPKEVMDDKVIILVDEDGDGRADRSKVFAGGLHVPTGLEFWGGGLFVGQQPNLMFLKDLDGDDVADVRDLVVHGIDSADTHHALNSFVLDPGGALYFQEGTFHHTQVETMWGVERCANAGVFRYEPRTQRFEVYVSYGFANPHGHVFDRWGQNFVTDGTGSVNYFAAAFSGRVDYPDKHRGLRPFFDQRTRPCPGTEIVSSRHFPDEMQGDYLVANVIGDQGILHYKVHDQGSGFGANEVEPMVMSSDPNFRPADLEIGPDGALWFIDWQNPIIGHMQHNLRDPSRDQKHGRVYRITYLGRPLSTPPRIAGEPIESLLDLLKHPEDRVRSRVRIELSARPTEAVIAAARSWLASLDRADRDYEHHVLEGLWVHQQHNVVDVDLLKRVLASSDFRARAAATRVLSYWRERVPGALDLLKALAADPYPRVRLEAVRAASFFTAPEAVEVPLIAGELPSDYYLDYTRGETLRTLEKHWKKALAEGRPIDVTSEAGQSFFLRNVSVDELLRRGRDRPVSVELLRRPGVLEEHRRGALSALAAIDKMSEIEVLLESIRQLDSKPASAEDGVLFDLGRLLAGRGPKELAASRAALEELAGGASQALVRQIGYLALFSADGAPDRVWELASRSAGSLRELVGAVPYIGDAGLRAALYPRLEALLDGLPPPLASAAPKGRGGLGRFVRIELRGRKTLTLAEVEVYSDGRNVAREGKAAQKNTAHGGAAARAIDGKTGGDYGGGGLTHTEENTRDPWWELDLGEERPIERIAVYNRTDGDLGKRLEGFTIEVLDAGRGEVFSKERNPAPAPRAVFELEGNDAASAIRRAAMNAMTYVRGQEAKTFKSLSRFVAEPGDRSAAIRALQRLPRVHWAREDAPALAKQVLAYVSAIPVADRTAPAALEALEFGEALASLLEPEEGRKLRAELGGLGVRIIRLGTLPEQMLYDKETLVMQAGKPVEIVFENNDLMPHNLVISQPGSLDEIGLAAEEMATKPGALERHYVPPSPKILLSSRLLQPRQSEKLSFTAPAAAGVYPFVCTYPGHWRRMFGALYVVEDLEAYLADPEGYLESRPVPVADALLKDRRPRTAWKLEDLMPALADLERGRSFANGRQMFQVANCMACHRLDGLGSEFGPDLAARDPKLGPADVLKDVIEPSSRIHEKYPTYVVVTKEGQVMTAILLAETPQAVKLIENPLAGAQPKELPRSEIARLEKVPTSIMPQGLLDTLSRDEALDLLAFIIARGAKEHPYFKGHDGHEGH